MKTLVHPASALAEADLVAECRRGNPRAQRVLYDRLAAKMMAVCLRYVRHPEDAEEVLMQGFVKVFQNLQGYRQEGCLNAWVRRIMVNTALSYLRSKRPAHLDLDDCTPQLASVAAQAESELATEDLQRLIQDLPAGYRTVFNLYAIEGYTHPEIGALLGISEGTSKSQLSKARAQLQRQLTAARFTTSYSQAYAA
ncbi:RNA polymerase sigma factor [Hymenobacter saemangeumensis]|uniref:RNA polymerase sigma factor n=1 Tax=Hymenobacter saemangeumensis TaxID=1084522 RepID=A0ABP8I6Z8_9BACT